MAIHLSPSEAKRLGISTQDSRRHATPKKTCAKCDGKGEVYVNVGPYESHWEPCECTRERAKPIVPPSTLFATHQGGVQVIWLPAWHPVSLNKLLGGRSRGGIIARHKLKQASMEFIGIRAMLHGTRKATGPRCVDLHLVMPKGGRRCDRDNMKKVSHDGLKHAGLLVDDSPNYCRDGSVTFSKALDDVWGTFIILTDVE